MQVVGIGDKKKKKMKDDLLEILDGFRTMIENGDIEEYVISAIDSTGDIQITVAAKDTVGAVGMFEMGKHIMLQHNDYADE
jgi:hypothetical protein